MWVLFIILLVFLIVVAGFKVLESININREANKINTEDDKLNSAVGYNYKRLQKLLAAKKWEKANRETANAIWKISRLVSKKESWKFKYPTIDVIENIVHIIPCEDLLTIDDLWIKYSEGRYGLSVQCKLYLAFYEEYTSRKMNASALETILDRFNFKDEIWDVMAKSFGWKNQLLGQEHLKGSFSSIQLRRRNEQLRNTSINWKKVKNGTGTQGALPNLADRVFFTKRRSSANRPDKYYYVASYYSEFLANVVSCRCNEVEYEDFFRTLPIIKGDINESIQQNWESRHSD